MDSISGAGFVIRNPDSRFVAARDVQFIDTSVHGAELRIVWKGITYARVILRADHLIVEWDSVLVVG